jgi:cobalt-precorrin 5A hydrolase/precorrin-3B C17-methyltransferase
VAVTPIVVSIHADARPFAERVASIIDGRAVQVSADTIKDVVREAFLSDRPVIGICASGILVRILAPCLGDKHTEPPVIAVAEDGTSVVPLLGGHHGANELAGRIARATGGHAAITTASEVRFGVSLEEVPGHHLANPTDVKPFVASLLTGASVKVEGEAPWLGSIPRSPKGHLTVTVTERKVTGNAATLVYHPRRLALGIGCERGTDPNSLTTFVSGVLDKGELAAEAIACVVSIDLKMDEPAIHVLAKKLGVPARFFNASELNAEAARLRNPSAAVLRETGCPGVAEGAALRASGQTGELIVEKTKGRGVTCAIARASGPIEASSVGRKRGSLAVVGIGPGSVELRTGAALEALGSATDWVGYGLYLDLIADIRGNRQEHRFPLGREGERARHALALADAGRDVALVCSGDAGIYAMASLVVELADNSRNDGSRASITVVPGVSAFQLASARAGALIGHDFCAVSLSDLLTPWSVIENRLRAAAESDFVVALYNPRSQRRTTQLEKAVSILSAHRPADTPVLIASCLGRENEKVAVVSLAEFDAEKVDMMTVVLVGSSESRSFVDGEGRTLAYTPRGYKCGASP